MNTYATLDNFKPGERWLAVSEGWQSLQGPFHEVECIEWSPSGKYVKVRFLTSGIVLWFPDVPYLLERLPDEGKTNQAAKPARTTQDDSFSRHFKFFNFIWPCICDHCNQQKAKLKASHDQAIETIKQQAAQKEIAASHKLD